MKIDSQLLRQIESDLGLQVPFLRGQQITVKNCWHFFTDGSAVDWIFLDDVDYIRGMNRVYIVSRKYRIVILAFSLMGTHVHFVLYGTFEDCNRFVHEYIRRTSMHIARRHREWHKMDGVSISHQAVEDADYLKTVICYTIKNAPVGRIPYNAYDYPWCSGALYLRHSGSWTSPAWSYPSALRPISSVMSSRQQEKRLGTNETLTGNPLMIGDLIFPGEYVAYEIVDRLFGTCRSFNYYMCRTKESDVDAHGGVISMLSIPLQEMRENRGMVCRELFGVDTPRRLSTTQRIKLAQTLRSRYNSSVKQICRLCGLVFQEAGDLL